MFVVHLWESNIYIRPSFKKCNTCSLNKIDVQLLHIQNFESSVVTLAETGISVSFRCRNSKYCLVSNLEISLSEIETGLWEITRQLSEIRVLYII